MVWKEELPFSCKYVSYSLYFYCFVCNIGVSFSVGHSQKYTEIFPFLNQFFKITLMDIIYIIIIWCKKSNCFFLDQTNPRGRKHYVWCNNLRSEQMNFILKAQVRIKSGKWQEWMQLTKYDIQWNKSYVCNSIL